MDQNIIDLLTWTSPLYYIVLNIQTTHIDTFKTILSLDTHTHTWARLYNAIGSIKSEKAGNTSTWLNRYRLIIENEWSNIRKYSDKNSIK